MNRFCFLKLMIEKTGLQKWSLVFYTIKRALNQKNIVEMRRTLLMKQ